MIAEQSSSSPPKKAKNNKKSQNEKQVTRSRSNSLFQKLGIRQKLVEDFAAMEQLEEVKSCKEC